MNEFGVSYMSLVARVRSYLIRRITCRLYMYIDIHSCTLYFALVEMEYDGLLVVLASDL